MSTSQKTNQLYKSGMSAFIKKEYGAAVDLFNQALDRDPDAFRVWVSRGASHLKRGRVDLALSDFSRAIVLSPDYARAYHMRALAHDQKGDTDAALRDLDQAIGLDPEYGAAYQSRAAVLGKTGQEDQALADMEMVTHITELKISEFANEHNILRSHHLALEAGEIVSELDR